VLATSNDSIDPDLIGGVFAYPLAGCGEFQCQPLWEGHTLANGFTSPPVVVDDVVLVGKGPASGFPVDAGIFSYSLGGCGSKVCAPISLVQVGEQQAYLGAPLAVAEGRIFMASNDSRDESTNVYTVALT
jgi:hypothetical protein